MPLDGRRSSRRPPSLLKFFVDRVHHWYEEKASLLGGKSCFCFVLEEYCGGGWQQEQGLGVREGEVDPRLGQKVLLLQMSLEWRKVRVIIISL